MVTGSKDWHQGGRDNSLLCTTCRTSVNKHGFLPPASKSANSSFMFKLVKAEEEVNSKHGMRTRRSRAPVSPDWDVDTPLRAFPPTKVCFKH